MRLDVSEILQEPGDVRPFDLEDVLDVPEGQDIKIVGPVKAKGVATGLGDSVYVEAHASGKVELQCSRCLAPYEHDFRLDVEGRFMKEGTEDKKPEEDEDVFLLNGLYAYLDEMLLNEIFLNIPMKPLCREDCKGICPTCGTNLNLEDCGCNRESEPTTVFGRKFLEAMEERGKTNGSSKAT